MDKSLKRKREEGDGEAPSDIKDMGAYMGSFALDSLRSGSADFSLDVRASMDGLGEWALDAGMPHAAAATLSSLAEPGEGGDVAPVGEQSALEKLLAGAFVHALHEVDARLKKLRTRLSQKDIVGLDAELRDLREELEKYLGEFDQLKSGNVLTAMSFYQLCRLEDFLKTNLLPQLSLYEKDFAHLRDPTVDMSDMAVCLSIIQQESAGPIFKDHPIGPFTLKLLTGATITQIQSGPVQPELIDSSLRVKRNNPEFELVRQTFKENATAQFVDLRFSSGTFPALVRLKFRVTIQLVINGVQMQKAIESAPSRPFIAMTNTGSQWKDAAGSWLKEDCFGDAEQVTLQRMWNYFQHHFLQATKQEATSLQRPLLLEDFEYMIRSRFQVSMEEKRTITASEFQGFWNWIGAGLKRIRYQKHLLWMFDQGFLPAFISGPNAAQQLSLEPPGTFLIRLSERFDGELVLSYVQRPMTVRHYILQSDDTADKKKTLIDFLGQSNVFLYILQLKITDGQRTWLRHDKDAVLQKFYKKPSKKAPASVSVENPYDTRLPLQLG